MNSKIDRQLLHLSWEDSEDQEALAILVRILDSCPNIVYGKGTSNGNVEELFINLKTIPNYDQTRN